MTQLMRAWTMTAPLELHEKDVARPQPADVPDGFVLLKIEAAGICGSDAPYVRGKKFPFPGTLEGDWLRPGQPCHEIVGIVEYSQCADAPVGQRMVGWATYFDGLCEYIVTEAAGLYPVPYGLSPADAVILQPLACIINAVSRVGEISGKRCAVLGLGPIGLLFIHVLSTNDAAAVVGVDSIDRSAIAAKLGADDVVRSTSADYAGQLEPENRFDVVIEAVGHQTGTLFDAIQIAAMAGIVYGFGVPDDPIYPIDYLSIFRKNLTLMSADTQHRQVALKAAIDYLAQHPAVGNLVTSVFPFDQVPQAYVEALRQSSDRLKVVLLR